MSTSTPRTLKGGPSNMTAVLTPGIAPNTVFMSTPRKPQTPSSTMPVANLEKMFNLSLRHVGVEATPRKQAPPTMDKVDTAPDWLKNDKKVLKFNGYFQQAVPNSPVENARVRHVIIYYYLDDGSVSINEPKIGNSGLSQGTLVARNSEKIGNLKVSYEN